MCLCLHHKYKEDLINLHSWLTLMILLFVKKMFWVLRSLCKTCLSCMYCEKKIPFTNYMCCWYTILNFSKDNLPHNKQSTAGLIKTTLQNCNMSTSIKLSANGPDNSCWPNNVGNCIIVSVCTSLNIWPVSNSSQHATTCNRVCKRT